VFYSRGWSDRSASFSAFRTGMPHSNRAPHARQPQTRPLCDRRLQSGHRSRPRTDGDARVMDRPRRADSLDVLWLYQREKETIRLRTAYDNAAKQFVATLMASNGHEQHVRFDSADAFRAWLQALEIRLERARWTAAGDPVLLPTGWPHRRLS